MWYIYPVSWAAVLSGFSFSPATNFNEPSYVSISSSAYVSLMFVVDLLVAKLSRKCQICRKYIVDREISIKYSCHEGGPLQLVFFFKPVTSWVKVTQLDIGLSNGFP